MGRIIDIFLVYQFIRRLATPFNKWKAYDLGIIDANGKVLKPRKDLSTQEEKNAWGYYDILVANLKKLLATVPFGRTRLASFAAAALLLREYREDQGKDPEDVELLEQHLEAYYEKALNEELNIDEEVPANAAGAGNVSGIGVGPDGEPGVSPRAKRKYKRKNEKEQRDVTARIPRGVM